jgi:DNA polymerase-3 subunit epsilon
METTRKAVAERAAQLLIDGFVLIDLETTGLSDDPDVAIIEITILDHTGKPLMDTLVNPGRRIPAGASRVNNIYDKDVADKATFPEIYAQVADLLNNKTIVAYNYSFEEDVLNAVCNRHGLPRIAPREWWCPMRAYSVYSGVRRYTKLVKAAQQEGIKVENAHRAIGDCIMTLELVKKMAEGAAPVQPSLF